MTGLQGTGRLLRVYGLAGLLLAAGAEGVAQPSDPVGHRHAVGEVETVPDRPRQGPPRDAHDGHRPGPEHGADDTWWHRLQDWVIGALGGVHPHEHEGDGHDGGREPVTITDFGEQTELFVEFLPLVVGESSELLVHVTRLTDFTPLEQGSVRVLLSGGEGLVEERFEAAEPSRPGLFRVPVTPQHAGARTLRVQVEAPGLSVAHRLGEQAVHPDMASASDRPVAPPHEGGVFLSKEQQWQSDFATTRVQVRRLRGSVPATGVLRASADGEAHVTAPSAGRLTAAPRGFPYAGLAVAGGEVLAYVVPALGGETDVAGLELALGRAESSLELARQERVRAEGLLARQAIPERRVAEARSAEHLAQAERDTAARRLAQVTGGPGAGQGDGIAVRAPLGGSIVQVHVGPGSYVERGERLFHLVDRSRLWLEARVAESDLPSIRHPTGAWFRGQGVDEPFEAGGDGTSRLVAFPGMVDPVSRTVPIVFELSSPGEPLRVGMYVTARVYTGEEVETLAVPSGAVVNDSGTEVVYVQRAGERFERRAVRTGLRDGEQVAVLEGLAAGDRVVSRGAYLLHLAAGAPADAGHGHRH